MLAVDTTAAELAARHSLRDQIARLERELSHTLARTYPHLTVARPIAHGGPRLLGLEALERTRDVLATRLSEVDRLAAEQREAQVQARALLAAMRADPAAYKGARVTDAELGLPGCTVYTVYTVRQGLLSGWWRVKISSGCPLPGS